MIDWIWPRLAMTRLADNEAGATAVSFALCTLPIAMLIGVGIDYGRALNARAIVQQATDAAALTIASAAMQSEATRTTLALNAISAALASQPAMTLTATPTIAISGTNATVTANVALELFFGQLLGVTSITLGATSQSTSNVSTSGPTYGRACVLAKQTSGDGIYTNSSSITANCGLYANSASPNGFDIDGTSVITSTFSCVAGNYDKDAVATMTPTPKTGCAMMDDPFATLAAPFNATAGCTYNDKKAKNGDALSPGVYCGGLEVESNAQVTFASGTYIVRDGSFKIGGGASATGSGVLFYLTGANSTFDFGSSATVQFKGLASGAQMGMVIWSASANSARHKFGCSSTSYLEGAIYSPGTDVEIGSSGAVNASADWTLWVVKRLQMGSGANLNLKTSFTAGATPAPQAITDGGLLYQLAAGATGVTGARLTR